MADRSRNARFFHPHDIGHFLNTIGRGSHQVLWRRFTYCIRSKNTNRLLFVSVSSKINTFRLRIRLIGMFIDQNVFEDATSGIRIRYDGPSRSQAVFEDATLTSPIRLNGMSLCKDLFDGSASRSLMGLNDVFL